MNVLIIGATGGTGQQLVRQALERDHTVTALVRDPAKLTLQHPNLRLAIGDVMQPATLLSAMQGQTAVLSALGTPTAQKDTLRSDGTRHVVAAMKQAGVDRFICQTTLGIGDSVGTLPFYFRYIIIPLFLRQTFADSLLQEAVIRQSGLRWTITRPASLTDGPRTGTYRHGFDGNDRSIKLKISRADAADFMLNQLTTDAYVHQTPGLSY